MALTMYKAVSMQQFGPRALVAHALTCARRGAEESVLQVRLSAWLLESVNRAGAMAKPGNSTPGKTV